MPLFDGLRHLRRRLSPLKERLLGQEVEEERGGDRGWIPAEAVQGLKARPSHGAGRDPGTGGPLVDVAFPDAQGLEILAPPAALLRGYESGQVWDLTPALRDAMGEGRPGLLIAFTLGHCHWSDRTQAALLAARPHWEAEGLAFVARAGDRLSKVYFRDVQIGDLKLTLPTFPLTLWLRPVEAGYALGALAMDPLGPDPDQAGVRALLAGENRVARGSDHFVVGACRGSFCVPLNAGNNFKLPISFSI